MLTNNDKTIPHYGTTDLVIIKASNSVCAALTLDNYVTAQLMVHHKDV